MNNEFELIELCNQGDVAAFENLISPYQQKIISTAYGVFGNKEDAYDIAQEAMLKIYKNISQFNGQSSFSTWVYRITVNMCLDEIRKRKSRIQTISMFQNSPDGEFELVAADTSANPEQIAEAKDTQQLIRSAIDRLPEEYRLVIILRELQGFDYQEIAQILQCSLGTVKSRISRARNLLKEILSQYRELL